MSNRADHWPIPAYLNLAISFAAAGISLGCLWWAAHAQTWVGVAAAALLFAFTNNTIFALHHEAVHGNFHPNRRINNAFGVVFAAFFPTIFQVQRISHLGHHRRNRTDEELYDCYLPHQSWLLKTYWIYCLLFGFYWSIIPVAGFLYLVCPWIFRSHWFQAGPARFWGFEPFVRDIATAPIYKVWPQAACTLVIHVSMCLTLDLSVASWLTCYWTFGLMWSSVQYTDHAGAPRDVIEGAWNLKFNRIIQALFLNYNFHLAHHRDPAVPWLYLPSQVRPDDANPSFFSIYWRLWLGARRAPEGPGPKPLSASGNVYD